MQETCAKYFPAFWDDFIIFPTFQHRQRIQLFRVQFAYSSLHNNNNNNNIQVWLRSFIACRVYSRIDYVITRIFPFLLFVL